MAEEENGKSVDVQTVRHLAGLMSRHDLSELVYETDDVLIRLRRGIPAGKTSMVAAPAVAPVAAAVVPSGTAVNSTPMLAPTVASAPVKPEKKLIEIKAPLVGTFYTKPNPESPPFVAVGAKLKQDTVVCLIEAMKVFNEITAECSGTVAEVLVENQQAVEYGQVLFRVDPA